MNSPNFSLQDKILNFEIINLNLKKYIKYNITGNNSTNIHNTLGICIS